MGYLIQAAMHGQQDWLDERWERVTIDPFVMTWLPDHRYQMSDTYATSVTSLRGGWTLVSARFDTGLEMTYRFRDVSGMQIDRCTGN